MKKAIVIGSPGAGKSTFAKSLALITGLPLYHLDLLYHRADKTTIPKEEFDATLSQWLNEDAYIIDGNYNRTLKMRLDACDTVFLFDLPVEVCLEGVKDRRGKPRSDMPWIETEEDLEFTAFIKEFPDTTLPKIYGLLSEYKDKELVIFHTREQAQAYLMALQGEDA